jgi:hypothetical protein
MSVPAWSRLAAPFAPDAVRWHAVAIDEAEGRLRLAPHLDPERLRARFDEVAGPQGWSLRLTAWGGDGLIAELTLADTVRSVVVRVAAVPGLQADDGALDAGRAATGAAWTAAAQAFGVQLPVHLRDDGWVAFDPVQREPLHRPEHEVAPDAGRDVGAVGDRGASPTPARTDAAADATDADEAKPEAHRVIDRLVDRLREEGLGAEAARLVAGYGGYGADLAASRELYAKLRALLLEGRVEA